MHPLDIQELLDRCVGMLRGHSSRADLLSCALGSRAWAHPAQSNLLREIYLAYGKKNGGNYWPRLQETLETSPHLIRKVRRVDVNPHLLSIEAFGALCSFPFTHLESVRLWFGENLSFRYVKAAQQLLCLPTLRGVDIECDTDWDPSEYLQIWTHLFPGIRHLSLMVMRDSGETFSPISPWPHCPPISLESLHMLCIGVDHWLQHARCPFDFSCLKALSIPLTDMVRLALAPQTIETLDLLLRYSLAELDLSSLPNLTLLRISLSSDSRSWTMARGILCTITPSSRIQRIIINPTYSVNTALELETLDSMLSALPAQNTPILELEMSVPQYANCVTYCKQLRSKRLLCRGDPDEEWFEHFRRRI
ncbi:hypothetical protein C8J57DRAFT_485747 [Mycena rebaudengoi]|nr:hypothetical protein C8J57DRAFT_485747 [Mycena rebaudengoi]